MHEHAELGVVEDLLALSLVSVGGRQQSRRAEEDCDANRAMEFHGWR
jgi:hypothetical protein